LKKGQKLQIWPQKSQTGNPAPNNARAPIAQDSSKGNQCTRRSKHSTNRIWRTCLSAHHKEIIAGQAGNKFLIKNVFQQFFKMKPFTPSSSKNILLFFVTFLFGSHQDEGQPAACNYLEFLSWCNEAASSR